MPSSPSTQFYAKVESQALALLFNNIGAEELIPRVESYAKVAGILRSITSVYSSIPLVLGVYFPNEVIRMQLTNSLSGIIESYKTRTVQKANMENISDFLIMVSSNREHFNDRLTRDWEGKILKDWLKFGETALSKKDSFAILTAIHLFQTPRASFNWDKEDDNAGSPERILVNRFLFEESIGVNELIKRWEEVQTTSLEGARHTGERT